MVLFSDGGRHLFESVYATATIEPVAGVWSASRGGSSPDGALNRTRLWGRACPKYSRGARGL